MEKQKIEIQGKRKYFLLLDKGSIAKPFCEHLLYLF